MTEWLWALSLTLVDIFDYGARPNNLIRSYVVWPNAGILYIIITKTVLYNTSTFMPVKGTDNK
jgi:hypothetical protein